MRKIIGVDNDDVLLDFNKVLQPWHNRKYCTNLRRDQIDQYDLWNLWGCSKEEAVRRVVEEFYFSQDFKDVKPYAGAQDGCAQLRRSFEVMESISARPQVIYEETYACIHGNFPGVFSEVICTGSYSLKGNKKSKVEVYRERGVYLVIEDSAQTALECHKAGIKVVLLNQPWNLRVVLPEAIARVDDWEGIVRETKRLAD